MREASSRVTESMTDASAAVDENSAAAAQMRTTTEHVTQVMLPIATTATTNATAAREAATSTRQLARGMIEIDATANSLRDQAELLKNLVERFTIAGNRPGAEIERPPASSPNATFALNRRSSAKRAS
jgi:methyl-accepting chemotaxis protein